MKTAVIGGGISGLTAAFLAKKKGISVTLFEKNSFLGGNIRTENINGFLLEHGPSSTLETSPLINELLKSLNIIDRKIYASPSAKKRYILKKGRLVKLPMNPPAFIMTKLFSPSAKLRLFKEPFIKSKSTELETIEEFTRRRLGQEFLDYAINPFVAGVFAGSPANLNVKAAFPKLFELEQKYGSLIKGQIKSRKERKNRNEKSKQSAKTFSFACGLIEIVNALYSRIKDSVCLNSEVTEISRIGKSYEVTFKNGSFNAKDNFDAVVIASPAYIATSLLSRLNAEISEQLRGLFYPPVAVILTGFRKDNFAFKPDGFGFLVPEVENRKILGSLWNSVIFPMRAPEGFELLTNFIGGSRQPELVQRSDDELIEITLGELGSIMGIKGHPDFVKIIRWEKSIPQYSRNHSVLTDKIDKLQLETPGLFICSNFYKGISICDCVKNAFYTADKLQEYKRNLV